MSTLDSIFDAAKDAAYMGVGAAAKAQDVAKDVASDLINRGKEALENGKEQNSELIHKVKDAGDSAAETALREALRLASPEDREKFLESAKKIVDELKGTSDKD